MRPTRPHDGCVGAFLRVALLGATILGCSDAGPPEGAGPDLALSTTRLCALVPARDPAAAAFPPAPPVKAFGTDLGFTYEVNGAIPMLFGDTWQRIDVCPIQVNDDSLATLTLPESDWPGFAAAESLPDSQCPELTFAVDEAGTSFAPIVLTRWDGVAVPLGPLNTPVAGFYDGEREWGVFIVDGGQRCSAEQVASAARCPADLSPQAADLVCASLAGRGLCADPTSTRRDVGSQAYYLHIAERVGPTSYVTRALFLTNKYLNLTARTVRSFDPDGRGRNDYEAGHGALLMWGRPGFDDQTGEGESPPYLLVHTLPLRIIDGRLEFRPRYFGGSIDGVPTFVSSQADAEPLYRGELEPVNQVAVSWVPPIGRWLTIYGGSTTDFLNPDGTAGASQPIRGAMYARVASQPWGPWSDPEPVLTNEQVAGDIVCGVQSPPGCLPPPDPPIRPACLELADPRGGGHLYGANVIDPMTRPAPGNARRIAADVFWNVSTWHPYSVVLLRTRVELE